MNTKKSLTLLISIFLCLIVNILYAQEALIESGKHMIALDEPFVLKLIIKSNHMANTHTAFPQIPGMLKSDVSSSTATTVEGGQTNIIQTITQNYVAPKEGKYLLKPFTIRINGETIRAQGATIQVRPPINPGYVFKNELYDELMEIERKRNEYADIQADAFFALTVDKEEIYVGEGFTVLLAFYVAETNKAELDSYKVGEQLVEILKQLRPTNCWEENLNIEEFQEAPVIINKKKYFRYAIYQAVFYPLNSKPIFFPEVGLTMIKYKVTQNADQSAVRKKEDFKTFYTKEKHINVKSLPPHPLQEEVSVGVFRLKESISNRQLQTSKSFTYQFDIIGEGNFSTVDLKPNTSPAFDFYSPAIKQQINRTNTKSSGVKSFIFQIISKEPGLHVLRNYFEWIYFDTQKQIYDTLSSSIAVQVSGESQKNADIILNEAGPVYKNMMQESNRLSSVHEEDWVRMFANIFILIMLLVAIILVFIKR